MEGGRGKERDGGRKKGKKGERDREGENVGRWGRRKEMWGERE